VAERDESPGAVEVVARFDQQVEYADLLRDAGFVPSVEVLEAGVRGLTVETAEQLGRESGTLALRTVKRWRADGRAVMVAVDVLPARPGEDDRLAGLDPSCGLFELVRQLTGNVVEWELAWPGAEVLRAPIRRWLEADRNRAVLTLDLVGITRRGDRAYHALEYHVPGAVPSGFVRTVRS
jgi:GntR family transcriptional regulator